MIDRYYERYGRRPMGVAADNTYGNGELLQWLDDRGITPYIRVKEGPNSPQKGVLTNGTVRTGTTRRLSAVEDVGRSRSARAASSVRSRSILAKRRDRRPMR